MHITINGGDSSPARTIRGILFDFDGTLTLPGAIDFPAIKRAISCPQDIPILEYLDTLTPEARLPLQHILEEMEEEAARESYPNQGAEACLQRLKRIGLPMGILTRNSLKSVCMALEGFANIGPEDFAVILTRDNTIPKPHPDGVQLAAKKMGIPVSELLMVGDFRFDVLCGKNAGAPTVLLAPDAGTVMHPGDPEPDFTVAGLMEILKILRL